MVPPQVPGLPRLLASQAARLPRQSAELKAGTTVAPDLRLFV